MARSWTRRFAALTLAAVMALGGVAHALVPALPAMTFVVSPLAANPAEDDIEAEIDGRLIVWVHAFNTADSSIGVRNLKTGELRYIGAGDGRMQEEPDVSGDYVVYQEDVGAHYDVRTYDWTAGTSSNVVSTTHDEMSPRVDGTIVVWHDATDDELWYRDYAGASTSPVQITYADGNISDWDVDNGRIYWSDIDYSDIRVAPIRPANSARQMTAFGSQPEFISYHGDWAGFTQSFGLVRSYNTRTRVMTPVVDSGTWASVFDTNEAWVTSGDVVFHQPYHINRTIDDTEGANRLSMYGHRIVWDHNDGSDWDIMMATGTSRLVSRTYGDNRYGTAAAVSQKYFEAGNFVWPTQDNVVLCTGENFPDALAAAPLARALQAPLLLTRRDSIPTETLAEITRLAPAKIYIIGGEPAISAAVETQLKATYATERIAGADRYETSAKVAAKLKSVLGSDNMFRAFFARGDLFPDALALGPVAAGGQGAILLVRPASVPSSVLSAVETLGIRRGYVAGDSTAVSNGVLAQLSTAIIDNGGSGISERWAGQSRYDTAVAVVVAGLANDWIDLDTLGVATGLNFPDALGGGSAMGYYGSPVILTGKDSFNTNVANFLAWHEYDIGRVDVFGGPDVVSDAVKDAIVAKVK